MVSTPPSHPRTIERDFLDARSRLLDLAAYLDRVERGGDTSDFRHTALLACLPLLLKHPPGTPRVKAILEALSDHSQAPVPVAPRQAAVGAPAPTATPAP